MRVPFIRRPRWPKNCRRANPTQTVLCVLLSFAGLAGKTNADAPTPLKRSDAFSFHSQASLTKNTQTRQPHSNGPMRVPFLFRLTVFSLAGWWPTALQQSIRVSFLRRVNPRRVTLTPAGWLAAHSAAPVRATTVICVCFCFLFRRPVCSLVGWWRTARPPCARLRSYACVFVFF